MKFDEYLRNRVFWFLDRIKGSPIGREKELLERVNSLRGQDILDYQQQALKKLLEHAQRTTAFYGKIQGEKLSDFPVITKNMLRESRADFLSSAYRQETLIPMSTSGSTGTPFTVLQDREKKDSVYSEVLYYNGKHGYQVGSRIVYLRTINSENKKSFLQQLRRNIFQVCCTDMGDQGMEYMFSEIRRLSRHSPVLLMGYGSTFDAMERYLLRAGRERARDCHVYAMISSSEYIYDHTRQYLEETFHCRCASRYANEENGFLGQDRDENNVFEINGAHYIVEILKMDEDLPAEPGELGRIVITDLKNYGQPMIRYDSGDVGSMAPEPDGIPRIRGFAGRKIDLLYDTSGRELTGFGVVMWKYSGFIRQLQIVQLGPKTYELKLNGENIPEQSVRDTLKSYLGADAQVTFSYEDEIPVLASGKRRAVVNLWKTREDGAISVHELNAKK